MSKNCFIYINRTLDVPIDNNSLLCKILIYLFLLLFIHRIHNIIYKLIFLTVVLKTTINDLYTNYLQRIVHLLPPTTNSLTTNKTPRTNSFKFILKPTKFSVNLNVSYILHLSSFVLYPGFPHEITLLTMGLYLS